MGTRRMAYWWFRFVVSGRFTEKFLNVRRAGPTESMIREKETGFPLETNTKRSPADYGPAKKRERLVQPG